LSCPKAKKEHVDKKRPLGRLPMSAGSRKSGNSGGYDSDRDISAAIGITSSLTEYNKHKNKILLFQFIWICYYKSPGDLVH
jgi:hypothetical protein